MSAKSRSRGYRDLRGSAKGLGGLCRGFKRVVGVMGVSYKLISATLCTRQKLQWMIIPKP